MPNPHPDSNQILSMQAAVQKYLQEEINASIMIASKTEKYADDEKETSRN